MNQSAMVNIAECLILDYVKVYLSNIIKEAVEQEITRRSEGKCKCSSAVMKSCQSDIPPSKSFRDDNNMLFHTGLPNLKVLKAIFVHVLETLPIEGVSKLTPSRSLCALC